MQGNRDAEVEVDRRHDPALQLELPELDLHAPGHLSKEKFMRRNPWNRRRAGRRASREGGGGGSPRRRSGEPPPARLHQQRVAPSFRRCLSIFF